MFRVCDLRSQHALVEPHIRCYCVEQSDIRGGPVQVLERICVLSVYGGLVIFLDGVLVGFKHFLLVGFKRFQAACGLRVSRATCTEANLIVLAGCTCASYGSICK